MKNILSMSEKKWLRKTDRFTIMRETKKKKYLLNNKKKTILNETHFYWNQINIAKWALHSGSGSED